MTSRSRPAWWGSSGHIVFTLVVFVTLASLDNAAIALIPAMVIPLTEALGTSETAIGVLTASVILVTAVTAVFWGYLGDRSNRKWLLFFGTLIWVAGTLLSAATVTYGQLFAAQMVMAVGLGSIASVGFSVVSDFVAPGRRGLAMSFWGLSQGTGFVAGGFIASQLGAESYRAPFLLVAVLGGVFALLYLFTFNAPRGYREPALAELYEAGGAYEHKIDPHQIPVLFRRRTNIWLILQGVTAQLAYGSILWVPTLYTEKILDQGYDLATANRTQGILVVIFQLGGLFSILGGVIGDRMQRRTSSGRAIVSSVGILGAIPFFLIFIWVPLTGIDVTAGGSTMTLLVDVVSNIFTNVWVFLALVSALLAMAFTSADSPNWFALISDVNLPEHRGTVFGLGNLTNGGGRAVGEAAAGALAGALERSFPPPVNWAISVSVFQVAFLPTGWMYWRASKTSPGDIRDVESTLRRRAGKP